MNTPTVDQSPAVLDASQALGQIAVELPGATAIFRRLKLDFCCGGQVSLGQATRDKGLDTAAVLAELAALPHTGAPQRIPTQPVELIEHILTRYHAVHRAQLPELVRMARRVEAVHAGHPAVPAGLAAHLEQMESELLDHMAKEETVLFPMLQRGGHPMVRHPIAMMRHEHVEHGAALERLDQLTHEQQAPEGACTTWRALYAGLAQLKEDLIAHIHLENNVLFPMFETAGTGSGCGGAGGCGCG
ncbi:MAG: iron-sulfur cluster repair protein YtfE [Pseudomonadota bacterium]